jgi:Zn-dependent M16 (insulinase) family peptidase
MEKAMIRVLFIGLLIKAKINGFFKKISKIVKLKFVLFYSEMQDHESEMERMIDQQRKNLFYPKGSSYAADTGGRLKNLRESCSLEKVRQYHRQFYHPNNLV